MLEFSNNDILHSCIELLRAILPNAVSEAKSRKTAFNIAKQKELEELSKIYQCRQDCIGELFSKVTYEFVKPWADRYYNAQDCKKEYVISLYKDTIKAHIEIASITPLHSCHFLPVYFLSNGNKKIISQNPIIYRWWFPADGEMVQSIFSQYPEKGNAKSLEDLFPRLKKKLINGQLYYALYLGQSENGYHRFSQHCIGSTHLSTLRKTVAALCFADVNDKKVQESNISNLLDTCYFEWIDFLEDAELVETIEAQCIAVGCYPLNLDANRAIDEKWIEYVMRQRKKIKE